jgi:aspartate ammonia-lyase
VENSIGVVTALVPAIGYEASTAVAKEALESGKSVSELVIARGLLTRQQLDELLDPANMTAPRR